MKMHVNVLSHKMVITVKHNFTTKVVHMNITKLTCCKQELISKNKTFFKIQLSLQLEQLLNPYSFAVLIRSVQMPKTSSDE